MKKLLYPMRVLHGKVHDWKTIKLPLYIERIMNPNALYLVMTPEHGNLGDHAITQSETELLKELGVSFIEITGKKLIQLKQHGFDFMNGRTILVNGGGFLGTLWPISEELLRSIITSNPKSTILVFPNTIYYSDDQNGKNELEKSIQIYNNHRHLKIYAREKTSFDKMKKIYNDVVFVPDMVLRMNKCLDGIDRKGCILCLRSDREKTRSAEQEQIVHEQIVKLFGKNVKNLDMVQKGNVSIQDRESALEKQFDAFRHAELVVTDRLHGMIFAAITGTPCIVIDSKSPKVRGCYEWIKELRYVAFCDDVTQLTGIYKQISKEEHHYHNEQLLPLYDVLKADINSAVRKQLCHWLV